MDDKQKARQLTGDPKKDYEKSVREKHTQEKHDEPDDPKKLYEKSVREKQTQKKHDEMDDEMIWEEMLGKDW